MQKIFKDEKGSVSLFILLAALFFLVVVTGVGVSLKNKESEIDSHYEKTKASYEKDIGNEEQIYNQKVNRTITFNANGGTVSITSKTVKVGDKYGELPIPTREGYTFKGWNGKNLLDEDNIKLNTYADKTGAIKPYFSNSKPWCCSDYIEIEGGKTYTFNPNSTKGNDDMAHCIYDSEKNFIQAYDTGLSTIKMPPNAKYIVVSYRSTLSPDQPSSNIQLEEGVTATEYETYYVTSSTKITQNKDHTLTAIWEPRDITVNFNANLFDAPETIENANGLQISYDKNTSILTMNGTSTSTATKTSIYLADNYNFVENEEYKTKLEHVSGSCTGNSILGVVTDVRKTSGASITSRNNNRANIIPFESDDIPILKINSCAATEGGAFEFWLWFHNGKNIYTFNNYKVRINFTKVQDKKVKYNSVYGELPIPKKKNYEFGGWYTGKNGTGTKIESTSNVQIKNDITLYAKWI